MNCKNKEIKRGLLNKKDPYLKKYGLFNNLTYNLKRNLIF